MKSREDTVGIRAKISPNNWRLRWQREVWKWTGKDGRILWELNEHEKKGTEEMRRRSLPPVAHASFLSDSKAVSNSLMYL